MAESSSNNPAPVPLVSCRFYNQIIVKFQLKLTIMILLVRGTKGVQLLEGTNFEPAPGFNPDPSKACRFAHDFQNLFYN